MRINHRSEPIFPILPIVISTGIHAILGAILAAAPGSALWIHIPNPNRTQTRFTFSGELATTPASNSIKSLFRKQKATSTQDTTIETTIGAIGAQPDVDTTDSINNPYFNEILKQIERKKFYPKSALRYQLEGLVKVKFEISPEGHVTNAHLGETQADAILNEAALQLIRTLDLPKPKAGPILLEVPIQYRLTQR